MNAIFQALSSGLNYAQVLTLMSHVAPKMKKMIEDARGRGHTDEAILGALSQDYANIANSKKAREIASEFPNNPTASQRARIKELRSKRETDLLKTLGIAAGTGLAAAGMQKMASLNPDEIISATKQPVQAMLGGQAPQQLTHQPGMPQGPVEPPVQAMGTEATPPHMPEMQPATMPETAAMSLQQAESVLEKTGQMQRIRNMLSAGTPVENVKLALQAFIPKKQLQALKAQGMDLEAAIDAIAAKYAKGASVESPMQPEPQQTPQRGPEVPMTPKSSETADVGEEGVKAKQYPPESGGMQRGEAGEQAVENPKQVFVPSHKGLKIGDAHEGSIIRGKEVIDSSSNIIPSEVYHVTTNLPSVNKSGYLKASGQGGLSGDKNDRIVSMTVNPEIAKQLESDIKFAAKFGQKKLDTKQSLDYLKKEAEKEGWNFTHSADSDDTPFSLLKSYFRSRYYDTGKTNPRFYDENILNVNPNDVGIVTIPKRNLNTGALLTNFDIGDKNLDEIRAYGNIPITKEEEFWHPLEPAKPGQKVILPNGEIGTLQGKKEKHDEVEVKGKKLKIPKEAAIPFTDEEIKAQDEAVEAYRRLTPEEQRSSVLLQYTPMMNGMVMAHFASKPGTVTIFFNVPDELSQKILSASTVPKTSGESGHGSYSIERADSRGSPFAEIRNNPDKYPHITIDVGHSNYTALSHAVNAEHKRRKQAEKAEEMKNAPPKTRKKK